MARLERQLSDTRADLRSTRASLEDTMSGDQAEIVSLSDQNASQMVELARVTAQVAELKAECSDVQQKWHSSDKDRRSIKDLHVDQMRSMQRRIDDEEHARMTLMATHESLRNESATKMRELEARLRQSNHQLVAQQSIHAKEIERQHERHQSVQVQLSEAHQRQQSSDKRLPQADARHKQEMQSAVAGKHAALNQTREDLTKRSAELLDVKEQLKSQAEELSDAQKAASSAASALQEAENRHRAELENLQKEHDALRERVRAAETGRASAENLRRSEEGPRASGTRSFGSEPPTGPMRTVATPVLPLARDADGSITMPDASTPSAPRSDVHPREARSTVSASLSGAEAQREGSVANEKRPRANVSECRYLFLDPARNDIDDNNVVDMSPEGRVQHSLNVSAECFQTLKDQVAALGPQHVPYSNSATCLNVRRTSHKGSKWESGRHRACTKCIQDKVFCV